MKRTVVVLFSVFATICFPEHTFPQRVTDESFKVIQPEPSVFSYLTLGEIKPEGWIKHEMQRDLDGMIGNLDRLIPQIMHDDRIWDRDRIELIQNKNGQISLSRPLARSWWSSESQGNWLDGYLRTVLLLNDETHRPRIDSLVNNLLSSQDADGYLGIYGPRIRYHHQNDNGELWAKTAVLRALLGYYEVTGNDRILKAIERAVTNVMENFTEKNPPFTQIEHFTSSRYGGLSHGIVFTDVLDRLFQLTGERKYLEYAIFLYRDFSRKTEVKMRDAKLENILDPSWKMVDHGVHVYEFLRPLVLSAYATGNPTLKEAVQIYTARIDSLLTPAGGPSGDEDILGREMDASKMGYEYCSIHEVTDSWSSLLQKSGDASYGDRIERTYFNAGLGARHPQESGICYLKFDNAYSLVGTPYLDGLREPEQTSYRYSPTHVEAAVCCVPMAGRIAPYYVRSMFMKEKNGLVATLLGPCRLSTHIGKTNVEIEEKTDYPFSNKIDFVITVDKPTEFTLKIRKPAWAKGVQTTIPHTDSNDYLIFKQKWAGMTTLKVKFEQQIEVKTDRNGEKYFCCGALVLASPISGHQVVTKTYPGSDLRESNYYPVAPILYRFPKEVHEDTQIMTDPIPGGIYKSVRINTLLINDDNGRMEKVTLYPVASTILRQVTFKPDKLCQ